MTWIRPTTWFLWREKERRETRNWAKGKFRFPQGTLTLSFYTTFHPTALSPLLRIESSSTAEVTSKSCQHLLESMGWSISSPKIPFAIRFQSPFCFNLFFSIKQILAFAAAISQRWLGPPKKLAKVDLAFPIFMNRPVVRKLKFFWPWNIPTNVRRVMAFFLPLQMGP